MTGAYYNEWEPEKAAVLRELIAASVIAPGDVDERSILVPLLRAAGDAINAELAQAFIEAYLETEAGATA